jgi:hypothetical protein
MSSSAALSEPTSVRPHFFAYDPKPGCNSARVSTVEQATCGWPHDLFLFLFGANRPVDRTALWTGAIALVTIAGVTFALLQLQSIRRISRADFAKRFVDAFFSDDTRTLFTLLMNSALEYSVRAIAEHGRPLARLPYFRLKPEVLNQFAGLMLVEPPRTGYTAFEIDDLLLGQFDDLGWYVKRGLIDYPTALQNFRYYLVECVEHPSVRQYMQDIENNGMYENVQYLYSRFKKSPPPPLGTSNKWWDHPVIKRIRRNYQSGNPPHPNGGD